MLVWVGVLFVFAITLGIFSYWGINTAERQHAYDEMAAVVPYSAGLSSALLVPAATGLLLWNLLKNKS